VTDKPPAKDGDKFRSIFSDNLQPITTRGKKARSTLLVINTVATAVPLSAHPCPLVITMKLAAAIFGGALYGGGVLSAQYYPCGLGLNLACDTRSIKRIRQIPAIKSHLKYNSFATISRIQDKKTTTHVQRIFILMAYGQFGPWSLRSFVTLDRTD